MEENIAKKCLIIGIIVAVSAGTIMIISTSMAINADDWKNYADEENQMNYWLGKYGYQEYKLKEQDIILTNLWMKQQGLVIGNAVRVVVNIGLILLFIGFIGYATNDRIDEKTKRTYLTIAAIVLFVMMLTTFYTSIGIIATTGP
ncbi:MAG: hypothetical protein CEE42_16305 [Promethearchaeota archaeon Loki_b31]|jgi:hypothetical protein|nr:MAG: hypothetical protein CEE42_16305 [Candidatus Lokiarchaeota archaeon Loki_b31]